MSSARPFFASVRRYFSRGGDLRFPTHISETMRFVDSGSKPILEEAVKAALEHIRLHWELVCAAYGRALHIGLRGDS